VSEIDLIVVVNERSKIVLLAACLQGCADLGRRILGYAQIAGVGCILKLPPATEQAHQLDYHKSNRRQYD
jgi:hypothetical protein